MNPKISIFQKIAWGFSVMFLFVYFLDYVPGIYDQNGKMFGLFSIGVMDDIGHLLAGGLAALAAWYSTRSTILYFKILAIAYILDVIIDFSWRVSQQGLGFTVAVNFPHILIAGAAFFLGFILIRKIIPELNRVS